MRWENTFPQITWRSASGINMFDYLFIALFAIVNYVFDIANWTTVFSIFYAVDLMRLRRCQNSVFLIPIMNFLYPIQAQFIYEILPFLILLFIIVPLRMTIEIFTFSKKQ